MFTVIDCAWNIGDYAADLKREGVETVIRYYNHRNSTRLPSKRLELSEAEAFTEAGLMLAVVFQQRGGAGGQIQDLDAAHGRQDAKRALNLAHDLGQPDGSAIYFAVDHDYYRSVELKQIGTYFSEIARVFDGKYRVGVYGSGTVGRAMRNAGHASLIWLAAATGWSGTRSALETDEWALYQKWPPRNWPGGDFSYDGNIVSPAWSDFGQFHLGDRTETKPRTTGASQPAVIMEVAARSGLNVRQGPGTEFSVETTLADGDLVHIAGRRGEWIRVDIQGDGRPDGFVHGDYLRPVSGGLPLPAPVGSTAYDIAKAEMAAGVVEAPGGQNNPRIVTYHESTKAWSGTDDAVAWCSSFVNYCVEQAGRIGTNSQRARSWEDWGADVTNDPREGDVAVFSRRNSSTDGGHVGFFVADLGNNVSILGGNQSNRVRITNYPKDGVLGPFDYELLTIRRG